jgi:YebC/PmpR family DNA-binding regulatory protein
MAGHSKWAQIKRKKAITDARRGKLWTKLLREVTIAARLGGGDAGGNPRLRAAIQEAKANNVPNDNIERAIKKGSGAAEGEALQEVTYEGYGPGGVAVLVEAMTDNRNRTVQDLRHLFSKNGGNLGDSGCVAWMFAKRGYFALQAGSLAEEEFMELALELGADDFSIEPDLYELFTAPEDFGAVSERLESKGMTPDDERLALIPQSQVRVDPEQAPKLLRLLEALEEHDDVQRVWANFDLDEEALADEAG